nr:hypothetical protein [Tanacetum cinerariifolium]
FSNGVSFAGVYVDGIYNNAHCATIEDGAFLTQGKASSIPTFFSWGGSISPGGFMTYILLLKVIIVAVAIVVTVVLVVVDAIIRPLGYVAGFLQSLKL